LRALRSDAAAALARARQNGRLRLSVLVTGGTGFVGKEILQQAARDADVERLVVLIRTKGELTPERRGADLLAQLSLTPAERGKFAFIAGDVEQPGLGIAAGAAESLASGITHVVHCAANVSFDDTYERSFQANVVAARHALHFSRALQEAPDSRFVAHVALGTSYLHGRCGERPADEDRLAFPADGFNNYYELTKAMAAIETQRHALERGLRAIELCPAIVIGDQRTGNNRGDTKVVNAPVNFLGRTKAWLEGRRAGALWQRGLAAVAARMALRFPSDADAALNLVTVDRVARGVLAALKKPRAVGCRIHLASDTRVSSLEMAGIIKEEMAIEVRLSNARVHRRLLLPLACAALKLVGREKTARRLHRLGSVFAGYSERGQPLHAVGNDVAVLGLPAERPAVAAALRMLCRHNEWVQEFGGVRDPHEIARRETAWAKIIEAIEQRAGRAAGRIPAGEFRDLLGAQLGFPALHAGRGLEPRLELSAA
jgi:nucleoside-diphosphate-sugar epimerase